MSEVNEDEQERLIWAKARRADKLMFQVIFAFSEKWKSKSKVNF